MRCALDLAPRLRWTVLQRTVEHAIKCIHDPRLLMIVLRELHLPELLEEDLSAPAARFEDSIRILRHHKVYKVVANWREALYNIREEWEGRVCSTPKNYTATPLLEQSKLASVTRSLMDSSTFFRREPWIRRASNMATCVCSCTLVA